MLDDWLHSLIFGQLETVLAYAGDVWSRLRELEPELELLVKLYIWRHTVVASMHSIGQQTLDLKFYDARTLQVASDKRLNGLGLATLFLPYVMKRFGHRIFESKTSARIETVTRLLNVINFVAFLVKGRYRSLSERALKITCGYSSLEAALNPVNYDHMSQELLWFTLAEFAAFALPYLNTKRVAKTITSWVSGPYENTSSKEKDHSSTRTKNDLKECAICDEPPTNAQQFGCNHIFCYYCVMNGFNADRKNGLKCPKCGFLLQDEAEIKAAIVKTF